MGPGSPFSPRAPCGPAGPMAPASPFGPAGPAGPASPRDPCAPAGPATPTGPTAPASPLGPCGPQYAMTTCRVSAPAVRFTMHVGGRYGTRNRKTPLLLVVAVNFPSSDTSTFGCPTLPETRRSPWLISARKMRISAEAGSAMHTVTPAKSYESRIVSLPFASGVVG